MIFGSKDSFAHDTYASATPGEVIDIIPPLDEWKELCVEPEDEWTVIPSESAHIRRC